MRSYELFLQPKNMFVVVLVSPHFRSHCRKGGPDQALQDTLKKNLFTVYTLHSRELKSPNQPATVRALRP